MMAITIDKVNICILTGDYELRKCTSDKLQIKLLQQQDCLSVLLPTSSSSLWLEPDAINVEITKDTQVARYGQQAVLVSGLTETGHVLFFDSVHDMRFFLKVVDDFRKGQKQSVFNERTEESSASQYFQFYGYLSQQQNMMQDFYRTSTYQRAIVSNSLDFKDKIVLDVGAGSGILSFFALQAGARKVYAVEASSMAKHAQKLVEHNKAQDKIIVVAGKIEEVQLPEKVDVIISEPMGYMLFNERMLETYLHAKKFLIPGGKMYPTQGDLHVAPFTDASLYMEQVNKANFWSQNCFHSVNLYALKEAAVKEYFRQPVVDTFDINICVAKSNSYSVNFLTAHENDLHNIDIPLHYTVHQTDYVHGLAFWFDVAFLGSEKSVWLSTSPTQPLTHWYQIRCLLDQPLIVYKGQTLTGRVQLIANKRQSYDVEIELINAAGQRASNTLDLKNPFFHYGGAATQPPPGSYETSPSEMLWNTIDQQQQAAAAAVAVAASAGVAQPLMPTNGNHITTGHALSTTTTVNVPPLISAPTANFYANGEPAYGTMNGSGQISPGRSGRMGQINMMNSVPTSICNNISSASFNAQTSSSFPLNTHLMVGDYASSGNLLISGQSNTVTYK